MTVRLAVDTAKTSGWCIRVDGKYHSSGFCDAFSDEPREVCRRAIALDPKAELWLERAFGGSLAVLQGLGAARGCWMSAWRSATGKKTMPRVHSTFPQTWRSELFQSTANFPLQEKLYAQIASGLSDVQPDQAAAVCFAAWADSRDKLALKSPSPNTHRVRRGRRDTRSATRQS